MLYWDADRQVSVAMLSNNSLAPGLQQRLQRAIVEFSQGETNRGETELGNSLAEIPVPVGKFELSSGETVEIVGAGQRRSVRRGGIDYPAYLIGSGVRYVPGLDLYLAGAPDGGLRWLSLYEDLRGRAKAAGN